ncbi:MAG: hypothetical protein KDB14_02730 [Planctomycetales bacterium]|nr:hypothetical protein [Planctomycetales bacterium]
MPGARWTKSETKSLRKQLKEGRAIEDVEIDGRSEHAIRRQAGRLNLISQRDGRYRWPQRQLDKLRELAGQGLTVGEIYEFELLGEPARSLWAIRKTWGRLGLSDPRRAERMRQRKVWAPGERRKFDAYLRKHSGAMTPEQIGTHWGLARSTVARRQTELGIKRTRAQVLKMEYSRNKREAARVRLRKRNLTYWRERRERREQELAELADQLRRRGCETQTCVDCGQSWPRRPEFFHTTEKRISIGTSRYFKHRCILCENRRRRQKAKQSAASADG